MTDEEPKDVATPKSESVSVENPRQVQVPRFVTDEDIGLGDVIKRATSVLGIPPCSGCERRRNRLNSRVRLTPKGK